MGVPGYATRRGPRRAKSSATATWRYRALPRTTSHYLALPRTTLSWYSNTAERDVAVLIVLKAERAPKGDTNSRI